MKYYIIENKSQDGPIMIPQVYNDKTIAMKDLQNLKDWCDVADFQIRMSNHLPDRYIDVRTRGGKE